MKTTIKLRTTRNALENIYLMEAGRQKVIQQYQMLAK